jgi:hypothetical protein
LHDELVASGYRNHCDGVAIEVAEALLKEGRKPEIVYVVAEDDGRLSPVGLTLASPKGSWAIHAVVRCDNQAFDPVLRVPVDFEHYGILLFQKHVVINNIEWTSEELRKVSG